SFSSFSLFLYLELFFCRVEVADSPHREELTVVVDHSRSSNPVFRLHTYKRKPRRDLVMRRHGISDPPMGYAKLC
ncbi:MAG: hypothetical protein LC775_13005, partial [Acidobacteria bacterium]|nr:hypothetical protein [Acidobacteriota bacterium]